MQNPLVDLVVTGRGEGAAVEIARRIALGEKEALRGRVISAEPEKSGTAGPAASLEIPGNRQNYLTPVVGAARGLAYVSSRGCPHRCTYCYNRAVNLSRWSGDSAGSVIEYLKNQARLGIEGVIFFDDNFFVSRKRVREIAAAIVELGFKLKLKEEHPGAHLSPVKAYLPYPGTALFDTAVAAVFTAPRSLVDNPIGISTGCQRDTQGFHSIPKGALWLSTNAPLSGAQGFRFRGTYSPYPWQRWWGSCYIFFNRA